MCRAPKKFDPPNSKIFFKFSQNFQRTEHPHRCRHSKIYRPPGALKNVMVPRNEFWVGGTWPPKGGRSPQLVGALGRDPKGARSCERTATISAAVAEKIAFENFFSTPPSGDPEHRSDPISSTSSHDLEAYIVWKFRDPTPPRSDVIRLFRNLKMPYYGSARHRYGFYTRACIRQK